MKKVKKLVDAGASIPAAIKEVLSQAGYETVSDFAERYKLNRAAVSNHINGNVKPTDETINALIDACGGGTASEWRVLLWKAAEPARASA